MSSIDSLFPILPRARYRRQLDNGLQILVSSVDDVEVVSSCLWYRYGAQDEVEGEFGGAHFLEHMMFKGSELYGPGEVDRVTQALGGINNAFTSQDATAYYFKFSPLHWQKALEIEADRMSNLTLDPDEIDRERKVILEELSMYEAEPWDALDQAVQTALHHGHPYARPILGSRDSLRGLGKPELSAIHGAHYHPGNAALVLTGGVGSDSLEVASEIFCAVPSGPFIPRRVGPGREVTEWERLTRHRGSVPRLLIGWQAPSADDPDFASLRIVTGVLAGGRSSRLHRLLVEEKQLCQWVSVDLTEVQGPGTLSLAAELHPGVQPETVEELVLAEIQRLVEQPVDLVELQRIQRYLLSSWIFAHDQAHDQALTLGFGMTLFDEDFVENQLRRCLTVTDSQVLDVAKRWLGEPRAVIGWSLPKVCENKASEVVSS